jgi:hypothetical protein
MENRYPKVTAVPKLVCDDFQNDSYVGGRDPNRRETLQRSAEQQRA